MSEADLRLVREALGSKGGVRNVIRRHLFELATGVSYPLVGLAFLVDPVAISVRSSIGRDLGFYAQAWSVAYLIGGVCLVLGILRPHLRLRAAGLILLGTGLLMQSVASVTFKLEPRDFFPAIYAAACLLRAWMIIHTFQAVKAAHR